MKVKYFSDSDTAYIEFSNQEVAETRDINENILIDLDKNCQLVGMTIEHADAQTNLSEISFQQLTKKVKIQPLPSKRVRAQTTPFPSISLADNHPTLSFPTFVIGNPSFPVSSALHAFGRYPSNSVIPAAIWYELLYLDIFRPLTENWPGLIVGGSFGCGQEEGIGESLT